MIVVGIDGGLAHMGLAAVEYDGPDATMRVRDSDVMETKPLAKKLKIRKGDDNMRRAREVAGRLVGFVDLWRPAAIVYEAQSFGMRGAVAARQAGTAFGIIAAVAEAKIIPLICVQPAELKAAVCPGVKKPSKLEVIDAVEKLFPGQVEWGRNENLWEHRGDAIAAAYTARRDELLLGMLRAIRAAAQSA